MGSADLPAPKQLGVQKIADLLYERSDTFRPGIDVAIAQSGNFARAMLTLRAS